jgi:NAD(P)H dehydrogenase (quinone)
VIRDLSKSSPWARLGCDIAIAELEDTGALTTAFEGTAGVFAMLPSVFDPPPGFPESIRRISSLSKVVDYDRKERPCQTARLYL